MRAKATSFTKSAGQILRESIGTRTSWDVFLSHSITDQVIVAGVVAFLSEAGHSVYVDWIDDPQMDRGAVNAATAEKLRGRMSACRSLIYLHSASSSASRWMPWELGYFDGMREHVAVLPVVKVEGAYRGSEYLALYPTVEVQKPPGKPVRFVVKPNDTLLSVWLAMRSAGNVLRGI